jgi:glycine C-acetyltransferase
VAGALKALELVTRSSLLRDQLQENTAIFRAGLERHGFDLLPGEHPIVPVMLHDAVVAGKFAEAMLTHGIYVVAFSYPVVPKGKARIRTQMSAALTPDDLELAIEAFGQVKKSMGL